MTPIRRPSRAAPAERVLVSIVLSTGSDVVDYIETFVTAYARGRFTPQVTQAVGTAAYELVANALSYGSISGEVVFELVRGASMVGVRVTNTTIPARIEVLSSQIARLASGAEAVYLEEMKRSIAGGTSRPRLGLARVAHEAKLALELTVEGNRITVTARGRG